jgi:hypothetical protein
MPIEYQVITRLSTMTTGSMGSPGVPIEIAYNVTAAGPTTAIIKSKSEPEYAHILIR